jgi:hypothetical protein
MNLFAVNNELAVKIDTHVNFGIRKAKKKKKNSKETSSKFPNLSDLKQSLDFDNKHEFGKKLYQRWEKLKKENKTITCAQDTACSLSGYSIRDEILAIKMPSDTTILNFFETIFNNDINFVITLDKIDSLSQFNYLPARNHSIEFSNYEISCLEEKKRAGTDVKKLVLTNLTTKMTKKFYNFEFDWQDDKQMRRYQLARFIAMIIKNEKSKSNVKKLVACSNGYSRCGHFICIYNAFKQLLAYNTFDLDSIIRKLREQKFEIIEKYADYEDMNYLLFEDFELVF